MLQHGPLLPSPRPAPLEMIVKRQRTESLVDGLSPSYRPAPLASLLVLKTSLNLRVPQSLGAMYSSVKVSSSQTCVVRGCCQRRRQRPAKLTLDGCMKRKVESWPIVCTRQLRVSMSHRSCVGRGTQAICGADNGSASHRGCNTVLARMLGGLLKGHGKSRWPCGAFYASDAGCS